MQLPLATDRDAAFLTAYSALNAKQRQAVDAIEGPVMVIAGPGTGKTQILTLRIANILRQTDTTPESILALTFTNAGARAMRTRLARFIGPLSYRVPIFTFHSFAEHLIKRFPEAYPTIIGGVAATDLEIVELIEEILVDPQFTVLRPSGRPDYYVSDIRSAISDLKKESYTSRDFSRFLAKQEEQLNEIPRYHEKGAHKGKERGEYRDALKYFERGRELLAVYQRYEALMHERGRYDYDDMVLTTVAALHGNEDMRLSVQETYQYVLADEHQDVSGSQNRILELITSFHERPNLFVVGDEKQAIYRFQGASLENFLHFERAYPAATLIALTQNYRSSQVILDIAGERIATDDVALSKLRVPLVSMTNEAADLSHRHFAHQAFEEAALVTTVRKLVAEGISPGEIAVMVRTNRQVESWSRVLRSAGVTVQASADSDILNEPLARMLLALIRAVVSPLDEGALAALLHEPLFSLTAPDVWRVLAARRYDTPLTVLLQEPERIPSLPPETIARLKELALVLETARHRLTFEAPQRVVAFLVEESGLLKAALAHDPLVSSRIIRRLYDEFEAQALRSPQRSLRDHLVAFERRAAHRLPLSAPIVPSGEAAVLVTTVHKAKGLEYEVVLMPELTDATWSGSVRSSSFRLPGGAGVAEDAAAYDDEVRLFYVALTRAKRRLYISSSAVGSDGRERSPARVLSELTHPALTTVMVSPTDAPHEAPVAALAMSAVSPVSVGWLTATLREHGLSATALNNYLASPWNYLYRSVLRIPEPKSLDLQFGTTMHAVIDAAVSTLKGGTDTLSLSSAKTILERELGRLPISRDEFVRLHGRALTALAGYLPHLEHGVVGVEHRTEASFTALLPTGVAALPELTLTGKLDRLDFDASGTLIRVTDYKTGKVKTRGQIEGTTKDGDGNYKRQLTFYALLLSLQADERYHCSSMVISFVEPTPRGDIKEELFLITDDEIAALRKEILRVVDEIVSGRSLQAPCDPEKSNYCDLVTQLTLRP